MNGKTEKPEKTEKTEKKHNIGGFPEGKETLAMLVGQVSRLFDAWIRKRTDAATVGVLTQHSARMILGYLSFRDRVPQTELVEHTNMKAPTISITLKKMQEEDLIRMEKSADDARSVLVTLTEKGKAHNDFVRKQFRDADRILMQNLSAEETELAKTVLLKMRANMLAELGDTFRGRKDLP